MLEMAELWNNGFWNIAIFAAIFFLILAVIFRRYITALAYDFFIDGLLSMIDEPLDLIMDASGIGSPIPWEPGDALAAILIYRKERHITGKIWAIFVAAEALSFGIEPALEMLPGGSIIAAPIGWFFNLCPTVTIVRMIAAKTDRAIKEEKLLDEELKVASEAGIDIKDEDKIRKQIKDLIDKEWPVEAIELYKKEKPEKKLADKLAGFVDTLISQANSIIDGIARQNIQAPDDLIAMLQDAIMEAEQLLSQARSYKSRFIGNIKSILGIGDTKPDDIRSAISLAIEARETIRKAAIEFNSRLKDM